MGAGQLSGGGGVQEAPGIGQPGSESGVVGVGTGTGGIESVLSGEAVTVGAEVGSEVVGADVGSVVVGADVRSVVVADVSSVVVGEDVGSDGLAPAVQAETRRSERAAVSKMRGNGAISPP
jgi:hypothetical protein